MTHTRAPQPSTVTEPRARLTHDQILRRLEGIEQDIADRQDKGETSAENYARAKRNYELDYAKAFVAAKGSPTEKKQQATETLEKHQTYFDLLESEGAYEGWKAVMRALEQRASIGQSLLKDSRESGAAPDGHVYGGQRAA